MIQKDEQRYVYYDSDLQLEAYNLRGIVQKFPNHFHEFYVIGFIEGGIRHLCCKGKTYDVRAGDLILFNPHDNHYCAPVDMEPLDYRAVNIDVEVMKKAAYEITGKAYLPHFTQNVVYQSDITKSLHDLYLTIVHKAPKLEKEEALFFLLENVLAEYAAPFDTTEQKEPLDQVKVLCAYMNEHFNENITLDDLLSMTTFGKSYLLRVFTKQIGVSPYRYLQTIRLAKAKEYLEEGHAVVDVAMMAGFSDQSHFTNFFKEFIGLTPKQYQRIFQPTKEKIDA